MPAANTTPARPDPFDAYIDQVVAEAPEPSGEVIAQLAALFGPFLHPSTSARGRRAVRRRPHNVRRAA